MDAIQKRSMALEMLAKLYDDAGKLLYARDIRADDLETEEELAVSAIIAALTPPEGYVLVPAVPTQEMLDAGWDADEAVADVPTTWAAMLAARPEVKV
jgi:hypothetical protein